MTLEEDRPATKADLEQFVDSVRGHVWLVGVTIVAVMLGFSAVENILALLFIK